MVERYRTRTPIQRARLLRSQFTHWSEAEADVQQRIAQSRLQVEARYWQRVLVELRQLFGHHQIRS
jgi:hypothetical protein